MPEASRSGRRRAARGIDREGAEEVGLAALLFLTADSARLSRFLALTGMTVDHLRANAQEAALQAAILDHVSRDESLLLEFAGNAGIAPDSIAQARELLIRHF